MTEIAHKLEEIEKVIEEVLQNVEDRHSHHVSHWRDDMNSDLESVFGLG